MVRWRTAALRLLALGATLGTLLDALHVVSGTTVYAAPFFGGQAAWVPPLFGLAAVGLGVARLAIGWRLGEGPRPVSSGEALAALACFTLAYLESAFLPPSLAAGALGLTAIGLFVSLDRSRAGALAALLAAITGPLAEAALSAAGAFHYVGDEADLVLGVATWLPLLYACAGLSVGALARFWARG